MKSGRKLINPFNFIAMRRALRAVSASLDAAASAPDQTPAPSNPKPSILPNALYVALEEYAVYRALTLSGKFEASKVTPAELFALNASGIRKVTAEQAAPILKTKEMAIRLRASRDTSVYPYDTANIIERIEAAAEKEGVESINCCTALLGRLGVINSPVFNKRAVLEPLEKILYRAIDKLDGDSKRQLLRIYARQLDEEFVGLPADQRRKLFCDKRIDIWKESDVLRAGRADKKRMITGFLARHADLYQLFEIFQANGLTGPLLDREDETTAFQIRQLLRCLGVRQMPEKAPPDTPPEDFRCAVQILKNEGIKPGYIRMILRDQAKDVIREMFPARLFSPFRSHAVKLKRPPAFCSASLAPRKSPNV